MELSEVNQGTGIRGWLVPETREFPVLTKTEGNTATNYQLYKGGSLGQVAAHGPCIALEMNQTIGTNKERVPEKEGG